MFGEGAALAAATDGRGQFRVVQEPSQLVETLGLGAIRHDLVIRFEEALETRMALDYQARAHARRMLEKRMLETAPPVEGRFAGIR